MFESLKIRESNMAQAGLPKLNLATKSISIKSSASSSLSSAQRSGVSYGIRAQRSNTSIFSPKMAFSGSTSAMRRQLNSRIVINNNMPPVRAQQDNGTSTMEKLMMFAMMGNMVTQFGKGIADTIKDIKGSDDKKDVKTKKPVEPANTTHIPDNEGAGSIIEGGNFYNTFTSADSFTKLKNINTSEKATALQSSYKNSLESSINPIKQDLADENIKAGLDLAGVTIDLSQLDLSEITLDVNNLSTFDTALGKVDEDIAKINTFKGTISASIGTLTQKSSDIGLSIRGLEASKTAAQAAEARGETPSPSSKELEEQINKLTEDRQKVDAALAELKSIQDKDVPGMISTLTAKKTEINDIKKVQAEFNDKKYALAEKLNNDIKQRKSQMDKAKKENDITKFNKLVATMKNLKAEVDAAGDPTEIKNSKNKSIGKFEEIAADYLTPMKTDINTEGSGQYRLNGLNFNTNPIGNTGNGFGNLSNTPSLKSYINTNFYNMGQARNIEKDLNTLGYSTYKGVKISKDYTGGCTIRLAPTINNPNGEIIKCANANEAIARIDSTSLLDFHKI